MLPIQALLILWTGIFWPPPRAMDQGTAVDKPITIRIVTDDQQPGQKPGLVIVEEPKSKGSASREGCQGCTLFTKVFKPGEGNPPRAAGQGRIQHFVIKACPEEGKAGAKPTHSEKKSAVFSKVFKFGGKGEACGSGAREGKAFAFTLSGDGDSCCAKTAEPGKKCTIKTRVIMRGEGEGGGGGDGEGIPMTIELQPADDDEGLTIENLPMTFEFGPGDDAEGMAIEGLPMTITGWFGDDPPQASGKAFIVGDEKGEAGPGGVLQFTVEGPGGIEVGGPWLGIQFGPVPKPLAAHLKLDASAGQMILNIIQDSPADKAGLAQYDVLVKIDGQDVTADTGKFMERVRELKPGQTCKLTVIQAGEQKKVNLTVGARPEATEPPKYKYETNLEELSQGQIFRRGGLLEKDPGGNWMFKQFDLEGLPDVFKLLPGEGEKSFELGPFEFSPSTDARTVIIKEGKSSSLRISRDDDGSIKVTRTETDKDGNEKTTTKAYANDDELKKEDPEAFDVLNKAGQGKVGVFGDGHAKIFVTPGGKAPKITPPDEIKVFVEEARKQAEEQRKQAEGMKGQAEAMKEKATAMKKAQEEYARAFAGGLPQTSFEVRSNGEVRVTQRRGNDELVEVFKNADELKAKRPDLYAKYEKLQRHTEEKGPSER